MSDLMTKLVIDKVIEAGGGSLELPYFIGCRIFFTGFL